MPLKLRQQQMSLGKNFLSAHLPAGQRLSQGSTPSPAGNTKITRLTLLTADVLQAYREMVQKFVCAHVKVLPKLCAHGGNNLCILCCWGDGSSAKTSPPLWCPAISVGDRNLSLGSLHRTDSWICPDKDINMAALLAKSTICSELMSNNQQGGLQAGTRAKVWFL